MANLLRSKMSGDGLVCAVNGFSGIQHFTCYFYCWEVLDGCPPMLVFIVYAVYDGDVVPGTWVAAYPL